MVIDYNQPSHVSILIKFERGNRRYRALNSLAGFACLVFWITLMKSDVISNIVIKFERVNRRYRALHCLAGLACLIFWFTLTEVEVISW